MFLKPPIVGTPLYTCVPMVDQDTGEVEWEPHKTKIHYWTKAGGNIYLNDHHCSLYFTEYQDAFDYCTLLNTNQCP